MDGFSVNASGGRGVGGERESDSRCTDLPHLGRQVQRASLAAAC